MRDLSKLNRAPERVVYLSANPKSYALQPENALPIKECAARRSHPSLLADRRSQVFGFGWRSSFAVMFK